MSNALSVANRTRRSAPRAVFATAAADILPAWDISLVFMGPSQARAMNIAMRSKDYIPNVLSYETGMTKPPRGVARGGEIMICLAEAQKQAPQFGLAYDDFCLYLFIHGLLHLKGMPHGARMERYERAALAQYLTPPQLLSWHDASQQASISARTKQR